MSAPALQPKPATSTVQLHVDGLLDGTHGVRVYHVTPARLGEPDTVRYVGKLDLPAWLIQRLQQQLSPIVEQLVDDTRLVWTGQELERLPADPLIGKLTKVLRGFKRVMLA